MNSERPDYSFIVRDNEKAAVRAITDGRYLEAFLLLHALIESLLRVFLGLEEGKLTFDKLIDRYTAFLDEQKYPYPTFVAKLRQFNRRRNRIVHDLRRKGYTYTNRQTQEAVSAAQLLYGLFIEWLETFDPEITQVGFEYDS